MLRLPWDWRLGPSDSSERDHLREMIPHLPPDALVAAACGRRLDGCVNRARNAQKTRRVAYPSRDDSLPVIVLEKAHVLDDLVAEARERKGRGGDQ